ncbi:50S ribosomal protein L34 [Candidatus Woesebacteria bacterium RIFCSPHIGHO2_01_FULL_39_17]|uniref:Large ribosomal subunit protein bL34 n=1 Tax=Candidatus Woesebacteria bacterium RIFCSPLOWO2_01_FULL_39_14 TaxID=1802518 RepID=A0A1F8BJ11_9BACT|nr:MAG: 50S ribosomal protein L34 [Candidatus Woesebacteria bacterium RIFCSPHIGHO2_01_FULL_39_17]OGM63288.1 MAG: 50S ribosomal protein L34 [Candidatus Woesebacteria bacterium RIFCSPLOWO2_01_FULL_39_14]
MPKRTYKPSRRKKIKTHGFRKRVSSRHGKNVIKRRTKKGRRRII